MKPAPSLKLVAYESNNRIRNAGKEPWRKETGLLSIWILGQFNPSPATTIVAPIKPGPDPELGVKVTSDYFGTVPPERLVVRDEVVFFSGDGQFRSKIGVNPRRAAGYHHNRSLTNNGIFATLVTSTAATNFADTSVANRMTYYYVVSGLNGAGESSNSPVVFATPGSQQLSGAIIGSAGSYDNLGNTITNAFDGNLNTFYDAADASGDWAGLDFGAGVSNVISEVFYCPRSGFASRMTNGIFQAANNASFSGAATLFTVAALPAQGVLTAQAIANTNAFRFVRYLGPANAYCDVAELQFNGWNAAVPPTATNPPPLGFQISGGQIQISWPADHTGWTLQVQSNAPSLGLTTNWIVVAGSSLTNQVGLPINPAGGSVFLRLTFP